MGLKTGILRLDAIDTGVGRVLRGRPVRCRKFSNIPGLCPARASGTTSPPHKPTQVVAIKNICRRCQMPLGRGKLLSSPLS